MIRLIHFLLLIALVIGRCSAAAQESGVLMPVEDSIKATPSRIVLGALTYGGKDDSVLTRELTIHGLTASTRLVEIDLSQAEGVQVTNKEETSEGVVIKLKIDLQQFVGKQPFGGFIKKIIRFETASADEPQVIVPILGWLAVNDSPRDFNQFVFNGNERWQGWWGTPNMAGAVLTPFILLLIGGMVWIWEVRVRPRGWLRLGISMLLVLEIFVLLFLLALTYSRGSWIAFAAGSLAMISSSESLRRPSIMALACFGIILVFLPSGLKRVDSYTQVAGDLSIANRLKLWTGAFQMMADHPLSGVGADHFGDIFERDYQTLEHTAKNSTAVSDYLTFGAERGFVLLGVSLGALLFVVTQAIREAMQSKSVLLLSLTSALISIVVASAFSTLWFVKEYQWLFGFIMFSLVVYGIRHLLREKNRNQQLLIYGINLGKCVGETLLVLGALAMMSLLLSPTKRYDVKVELANGDKLLCRLFEPRWKIAKGVIIYFPDIGEEPGLLCHSTLRPLSALGWDVVSLPVGIDEAKTKPLLFAVHRMFPDKKIFLSGDGAGGKLAWNVTTELAEPIQAGAGFDFLSEKLDSNRGGRLLQHPFLVFQSLYNDQLSANPAIRASRRLGFVNFPLSVVLSPNSIGYFSEGRKQWVRDLDSYCVDQ